MKIDIIEYFCSEISNKQQTKSEDYEKNSICHFSTV